jgi:hypothetical protein
VETTPARPTASREAPPATELVVAGDRGHELTEGGCALLAAGQPLVACADGWARQSR